MMARYIVLILFAFLVEGVFGDEVKSVKEGDRVPLNTGVHKPPTKTMLWYFNDNLIALINGHPETSCLYEGPDGIFRDRLKVDYETGSLTITDITTEHAGRYEAEYDEENNPNKVETLNRPVNEKRCEKTKDTKKGDHGKIIKSYSLTVSVTVKEGDRVPLNTGVHKPPTKTMLWYFNDNLIALINGHPETSCLYDGEDGRFRHRLDVDYETGSLTITDITTQHTGRYEAEYDEENKPNKVETLNRPVNEKRCEKTKDTKKGDHGKIIKSYSLTVSGSGLSPAAVAGMCVAFLLLAAAVVGGVIGVIYCRHSIFKNDKKKLKQVLEHVSNDEKQNEEKHMI